MHPLILGHVRNFGPVEVELVPVTVLVKKYRVSQRRVPITVAGYLKKSPVANQPRKFVLK